MVPFSPPDERLHVQLLVNQPERITRIQLFSISKSTTMNIYEAAKQTDTLYVDVRTKMEYDMGHVPGCIHIPLDEIPARWKEIDGIGQKHAIFYCRSGNRSGQAVMFLKQHGIDNIYNGGGLEDAMMLKSMQA